MKAGVEQPRHRGRFDAALDDHAMLKVVGEVLRHAKGEQPASVSQRRFDAARAGAGHPECPTARAVVMRLNRDDRRRLTWAQIAELATREDRSVTQTLVAAQRADVAEDLNERHVYFALRFVAKRAGLDAPNRTQYQAEHAKAVAALKRAANGAATALLLPTAGQIDRLFQGDWDAALRAADLTPASAPMPVPPPRPRGLAREEAIAAFVKTNGYWPSATVLGAFCGELGIRLARTSRPAAEDRKAAAVLLARDGVALPADPGPPAGARGRRFELPPGGLPGAPRSGPAELKWDEAACVDALARWLRLLPAGAKRTRQAYLSYSVGKADVPAPNQFDRHGGFAKLRKKAQAQLDQQRRGAAVRSG